MFVSRVLAPVAVAASLLAGALGASPLPGPAADQPVAASAAVAAPAASAPLASPAVVAIAAHGPIQPAQAGSVDVDTYYDSADPDVSNASGTRFVAVMQPSDSGVPDFGSPPSGEVPILFNDRHVYSKPDHLTRGRLLAALVKDGAILVPLRSLFEQLGATVSYDPSTKTATAHKAGTEIKLIVGKNIAIIDGTTRPLDVPPMQIGSSILVPVRVIAEVFGAYVQWLPDKRAVAIRYLAPGTVPPAAVETPVPLSVATPLPTPRPRRTVGPGPVVPKGPPTDETFIAIDPLIGPSVGNAFDPNIGGAGGLSFVLRGATEFNLLGAQFEVDGRYTKNRYPHPNGYVTVIGGHGATFVPAFIADDYNVSGNVGIQLTPEKFYLAASYASVYGNYGYPRLNGLGLGLNKLPVLDRAISYEGEFYYYPNVNGTCKAGCRTPYELSYKMFRYSAGLTALIGHKVFVEAGYQGDKGLAKSFAPDSFSHDGPFGGLGVRF